jgi:hypothetical protein
MRRFIHRAGTAVIWISMIYFSLSFIYSLIEVARHAVNGDSAAHIAAHAAMALIYGAASILMIALLYPPHTCPDCQGWGTVYRPMAEAKIMQCPRCDGKGKILGRRSDQ